MSDKSSLIVTSLPHEKPTEKIDKIDEENNSDEHTDKQETKTNDNEKDYAKPKSNHDLNPNHKSHHKSNENKESDSENDSKYLKDIVKDKSKSKNNSELIIKTVTSDVHISDSESKHSKYSYDSSLLHSTTHPTPKLNMRNRSDSIYSSFSDGRSDSILNENCYDYSQSTTFLDLSKDQYPFEQTPQQLNFVQKTQPEFASTQIADAISLNGKMIQNPKQNQQLIHSQSALVFPQVDQQGVFNLMDTISHGRLTQNGNNMKQGHELVNIEIDNQLNAGYIFFELEQDEKVGRYLELDSISVKSNITLSSDFSVSKIKLKLAMNSNFLMVSSKQWDLLIKLIQDYLDKQEAKSSFDRPHCYIDKMNGRKLLKCNKKTDIKISIQLKQDNYTYNIDSWNLRTDKNTEKYYVFLITNHFGPDDLVILGFKFWNQDSQFDSSTNRIGLSTKQFCSAGNGWHMSHQIVAGLLVVVLLIYFAQYIYRISRVRIIKMREINKDNLYKEGLMASWSHKKIHNSTQGTKVSHNTINKFNPEFQVVNSNQNQISFKVESNEINNFKMLKNTTVEPMNLSDKVNQTSIRSLDIIDEREELESINDDLECISNVINEDTIYDKII